MSMRTRNPIDVWLPVVALFIIAATALLTYVGSVLSSFRGSSLAYLGWALLGLSIVISVAVLAGASRRSAVILRNVVFMGGVVVMGLAVGLAVYTNNMFAWK